MKSASRLIALLAAAALIATLVACGAGNSEPTPRPAGTTKTTTSPTTDASESPTPTPQLEVLPPLTPFGPELAAKLQSIKDKVAEIRGLPVPDLAQEGVARPEDVLQNNLDFFANISEEDKRDSEAWLQALRMLQLVPETYTLENFAENYSTGIAGFYSTENDALVLIGEPDEEISKYDELILAHEYTHALQDASFDLDALQDLYADHPDDEGGLTSYAEMTSCVIEGDATLTENLYMEEVYGPDWEFEVYSELDFDDFGGSGGGYPDFLANAFNFNYFECYDFVREIYDGGGWAAVNDMFVTLPATTEQILDIDKYRNYELASDGPPEDLTEDILSDWTAIDIGQFGAYDTQNYVQTITGDYNEAARAARGWGSGWLRIYQNTDGASVLQLQLSFDTEEDLEQFEDAFADVLDEYGANPPPAFEDAVQRFTVPGGRYYYGAVGSSGPFGIEMVLATDQAALNRAYVHLQ
jgi:hypothetical protein